MTERNIANNKEEVPFVHYLGQYAALDPAEVSARTGVPFENGAFSVCLMGETYRIGWPEYAIGAETGRKSADLEAGSEAGPAADGPAETGRLFALTSLPCQTFLLRFLIEGKKALPYAEMKTFREMPWGELYIAPYTGRCLKRAAFSFGAKCAAFAEACARMGALRVPHGDAGYDFEFLPGYHIQILVYEGDEEFAPSAQILYSDNFADAFSAEDRVVAAELLISAVKREMERGAE